MTNSILVIDDDATMHDILRAHLEKCCYQVISAFNGDTGLNTMLNKRPNLVLLDFMMPFGGDKVLDELISNPRYASVRNTPIIFLTARGGDELLVRDLFEKGIIAYLKKPFGMRELLNIIENVLILHDLRQHQIGKDEVRAKSQIVLSSNVEDTNEYKLSPKGNFIGQSKISPQHTPEPSEEDVVVSAFVHQIRNHLGLARAIVKEMIEGDKKNKTKFFESEILAQRIDASLALVDGFLYSRKRLPKGGYNRVSIPEVLKQAIETIIVPESIELKLNIANDMPSVLAEASELAIAISNIIQNSIQALPSGGVIMLTAQVTQQDEKQYIEITITDNGPGIAPEVLQDLFQRKVTKKPGGLGIGLWLTKTIINSLGGQIFVRQASNRGTEVQVLLNSVGNIK